MPISVNYVECPYCSKDVRIDKLTAHLCTHAIMIISTMSEAERTATVKNRKPIVFGRGFVEAGKVDVLFTVCLHCKKGRLSCSKRNAVYDHSKCIEAFEQYTNLFTSVTETTPCRLPSWKHKTKGQYVKTSGKELVLSKPVTVIESAPVEPVVTEVKTVETVGDMPQHLVDRIMEWWMIGRDADQEVEEDEVTIYDKLTKMLDTFDKQNSKLNRAGKFAISLQARVSTLEGILEDNNIQF